MLFLYFSFFHPFFCLSYCIFCFILCQYLSLYLVLSFAFFEYNIHYLYFIFIDVLCQHICHKNKLELLNFLFNNSSSIFLPKRSVPIDRNINVFLLRPQKHHFFQKTALNPYGQPHGAPDISPSFLSIIISCKLLHLLNACSAILSIFDCIVIFFKFVEKSNA